MPDIRFIKRPTLLVDPNIVSRNIENMKQRARVAGASFRPHFKTHQSGVIGEWFREAGVQKITVSSVQMAHYFASYGWKDITIAFPFNIRETEDLAQLQKLADITILTASVETIAYIENHLNKPVNVQIKIDSGAGRAGLSFQDTEVVRVLVDRLEKSSILKFTGFLSHAGQTYQARGSDGIQQIADQSHRDFRQLINSIGKTECQVSWGDTPSCSKASMNGYFDEWRPGNFVFHDIMQYHLGSCNLDDIAAVVACPVVEVHKQQKRMIIYGGAVHFSKDFIEADAGFRLYGYLVNLSRDGWSGPVAGAWLSSVSQEHGVVRFSDEAVNNYKAGDIIGILPVHSCLAVSALREIFTTDGQHCPVMS